jgi:diacylglycerol kinase (ATP)
VKWSVAVGFRAADAARGVADALVARGHEAELIHATDREALVDASARAAEVGDAVFAVGGDGSLNAVVDGLVGSGVEQPVLAVLPAGTGSDFARMFALPGDPGAAVDRALAAGPNPIDVALLSGPWGQRVAVNEGQAGLGGRTAELAERLPRSWGSTKYDIAFWGALPTFGPGPATLTTDRRTVELSEGIVVVACNGEFFGGGMRIAPKASVVDGAFDLIVVEARRSRALSLFPRMKRGLHLTDPAVRRVVTPWFRLETETPWPVEIDGDHVGTTPLEGRILPAAVDLRV